MIKLHRNGDLNQNTWIYINEATKEAIIVDPGTELEKLYKIIDSYIPTHIFITHAHFDHIQGLQELKNKYPSIIIVAHELSNNILPNPKENLSYIMGLDIKAPKADFTYNGENLKLEAAGKTWTLIHTPGHCPDHTIFTDEDSIVFAGDLIFEGGGVGRSDFPNSNITAMPVSIKKILSLPKNLIVYSGHGNTFTIEEAKLYL